jgi:putative CocE/NonD family hydrolase
MTLVSRFMERVMDLPRAETHAVRVERDLRVPMPDGVLLLADRYVPPPPGRALVLVRSPYGRRGPFGLLYGRLLAERGFQVLVQSCRGTFGSGGTFDPFGPDERLDGLATVEWMRRQPWYPGAFGTTGPSYLGMTQWAIAGRVGREHRAMAAQVTTDTPHDVVFAGDAPALETMLGWITQVANQERRLALLHLRRVEGMVEPLFGRLPLGDLDRLATGHPVPYWQAWLAHPEPGDGYWANRQYAEAVPRVETPVSLVSGWDDFLLTPTIRSYRVLRAAGREPRLTLGPWRHADQGLIGAGITDSVAWFRAHLMDDRSGLRAQPVRIFVTGADEWRELPDWPPPARLERWHLHAGARLHPDPPEESAPDRHTYDPARPTPSLGGPTGRQRTARVDNRPLEARDDVLTYTSDPLDRDLELIGAVSVDLHLGTDNTNLDCFARLCDVDGAGVSLNICDALLRLAPDRPAAEADGTLRARFDLSALGHRFRRGHRLRLQVSGGAHPRYARNMGTGDLPLAATRLEPSRRRVHHDPAHPSAIILPVVALL